MQTKHQTRILYTICTFVLISCAYGAHKHGGVFTVTFSNGTEGAFPFQVPASLRYAATPGTPGADMSAVSRCCMPLHADVEWYDSTKYTLHSSTDCNAAYRVCSLPSKVQAVWVCGCPGGDCSGAHKISSKSMILGADRVAAAAAAGVADTPQVSSTAHLFAHQGLPTRITALTIRDKARKVYVSSSSPASCDIQGFRVEYMQNSEVLGPSGVGKAAKTVLGSGLKNDPVVSVLYQKNQGCLTYIMMRARSGRTAQAGSLNPALQMQTATAPEGTEGLAGLEVTLTPQQQQKGGLASLQLLWGSSQCSVKQGMQQSDAIQATPAAAVPDTAAAPATAPMSADVVAATLGMQVPGPTWTPALAVEANTAEAYSKPEADVRASITAAAPAGAEAPAEPGGPEPQQLDIAVAAAKAAAPAAPEATAAAPAAQPSSSVQQPAAPVAAVPTAQQPTPAASAETPGIPPRQAPEPAAAATPAAADGTPPTFTTAAELLQELAAEQAQQPVEAVTTPPAPSRPLRPSALELNPASAAKVGAAIGTATAAAFKAASTYRIHTAAVKPGPCADTAQQQPSTAPPAVAATITSADPATTAAAPAAAETVKGESPNSSCCTGRAAPPPAKKGAGMKAAIQKVAAAVGKVIVKTAQAADKLQTAANAAQAAAMNATDAAQAAAVNATDADAIPTEPLPASQDPAAEGTVLAQTSAVQGTTLAQSSAAGGTVHAQTSAAEGTVLAQTTAEEGTALAQPNATEAPQAATAGAQTQAAVQELNQTELQALALEEQPADAAATEDAAATVDAAAVTADDAAGTTDDAAVTGDGAVSAEDVVVSASTPVLGAAAYQDAAVATETKTAATTATTATATTAATSPTATAAAAAKSIAGAAAPSTGTAAQGTAAPIDKAPTVKAPTGTAPTDAAAKGTAASPAGTAGNATAGIATAGDATAGDATAEPYTGKATAADKVTAAEPDMAAAAARRVSVKRFFGPERRPPVSMAAAAMDSVDAAKASKMTKSSMPMPAPTSAVVSHQDGAQMRSAAQQPGAAQHTGAAYQNVVAQQTGFQPPAAGSKAPDVGSLPTVSTASAASARPSSSKKFIGPVRRPAAQVATAAVTEKLDDVIKTSAAPATPAAAPAAPAATAAAKSQVDSVYSDQDFFEALTHLEDTSASASDDKDPEGLSEAQQSAEPGMQWTAGTAGTASTAAVSVAATATGHPSEPATLQQQSTPSPARPFVKQAQSGYRVTGYSQERIADGLVPQLAALASNSRQQTQGLQLASLASAIRQQTKGRKLMEADAGRVLEQQEAFTVPAAASSTRHLTSSTTTAGSNSNRWRGGGRFPPCRLSDPFCFTDSECYCRLANGTYGAACPMYGTCFGGCCSTTGECSSRMGYEDPKTGQQQVLLAHTCSDWGLNEAGPLHSSWTAAAAAAAGEAAAGQESGLECKLPKGRSCDTSKAGVACMGYTAAVPQAKCADNGCEGVQVQEGLSGAMCVFNKGDARRFDVCSCSPVY